MFFSKRFSHTIRKNRETASGAEGSGQSVKTKEAVNVDNPRPALFGSLTFAVSVDRFWSDIGIVPAGNVK